MTYYCNLFFLLEKATTIKKFEYSPLGNKFKKQADVAKKQYQRLDKAFEFDMKVEPIIKVKKLKQQLKLVLRNIINQIYATI